MRAFKRLPVPGAALLVVLVAAGVVAATAVPSAGAEPARERGYEFTVIAFLGDPAPGGGEFTFDFEPWTINRRGDVAFAADLTTGGEGVFVWRNGEVIEIMRSGDPAPGGGTFEGAVFADTAVNDRGDVVFPFSLSPFTLPFGVNAGLYLYSTARRSLEPLVQPLVTPAPGGGTFSGVTFRASMNNRGQIAFSGIIPTDEGVHILGQDYIGLGMGLFLVDRRGRIHSVVSPGDPAPGGGVFDYAGLPSLNDRGDLVFDGHLASEECIDLGIPQAVQILCLSGLYLRTPSGETRAIARPGDPAPGGGTIRAASLGTINGSGDIAFFADLTPAPGVFEHKAVLLYRDGEILPVARAGDPLPGGGSVVTVLSRPLNHDVNDRGDVTFHAILDTDDNADGLPDTGLYLWSRGSVRLVLRTGTTIPGVGTVAHVVAQGLVGSPFPAGAGALNNRGQIVCQVTLEDGRGALLLATLSWLRRLSSTGSTTDG